MQTRQRRLGLPDNVQRLDLDQVATTIGMAKRPGNGPFDAAPIVQGDVAGTVYSDHISYSRGAVIGNAIAPFYSRIDPYQFTYMAWITPEWDGDDGIQHYFYRCQDWSFALYKTKANMLLLYTMGEYVGVDISGWNAGDTHLVIARLDVKNPLDDSGNYACLSIDDVHTFGIVTQPDYTEPSASQWFGPFWQYASNAIIEGAHLFRRCLYDGTYGTPPVDGTDELAAIYAAGAGKDPAQVTGSWDVCLGVPTNCSTGALVTGTGEAWSQPHASSLPDVSFMSDGDPPGTPYAVECDGSTTYVDCGSGPTLDDIPNGGEITVHGWFRIDSDPGSNAQVLACKGYASVDGWLLYYDSSVDLVRFRVRAGGANIVANRGGFVPDGKFHHFAGHYDDTTKTARVAVDGVWGAASVGAGVYASDAARSLLIGRHPAGVNWWLLGGWAWGEVWDNDHLGAGTDFVPPRVPTAAGPANLIETWWADEGTGATVAARVTSPANDGTITSGSWSAVWEQEGTPIIPQSLYFAGDTSANCGSPAALDNMTQGANGVTIDFWLRHDGYVGAAAMIFCKNSFHCQVNPTGTKLWVYVPHATTWASSSVSIPNKYGDEKHHHVAVSFMSVAAGGDGMIYIAIDGIWGPYANQTAGVGAVIADAAASLYLGWDAGSNYLIGCLDYLRFSDISTRYVVGTDFVPPSRSNPPAADGNTIAQYNFVDGAGTTLTDIVAANNGTITMGSGRWLSTCDMETESPGERLYPWGYAIGSDGADDGLTIIEDQEVVAETDYVIRASLSVGMSGRAKPYIYVYDNDNAAQIGADFPYPFMTGTHDGANNSANLDDSTARWVINLDGWTVYNITDGSSGEIASNSQNQVVVTLAGGTDNDWDTGDEYMLRPPSNRSYSQHPWQETFVIRTPAGCTSIDVKVLNSAGEGVVHIHQVEVYKSELDNGDMESLQGTNPELPTGFTNATLDPGDTVAEAVIIHSGAQSLEWSVDAKSEYMVQTATPTIANGRFFAFCQWVYGDGGALNNVPRPRSALAAIQNDATYDDINPAENVTAWRHFPVIWRARQNNPVIRYHSGYSPAGARYSDDAYLILLDDVSFTVTPASEPNSLESGGIRVDGTDNCTHPIGRLKETGAFALRGGVRQDIGTIGAFCATYAYLCDLRLDANNYLFLRLDNANQLELEFNAKGAGAENVTWNASAEWAIGDNKLIEVYYGTFGVRVYVDGRQRLTSNAPCVLAGPPTTWQIGADTGVAQQGDIVISSP